MRAGTVAKSVGAICVLVVGAELTGLSRAAISSPAPPAPSPEPGQLVAPVALAGLDLDAPHHDYPAADLAVGTGTPVRSMVAGTVEFVDGDCGLGIRVHAADGTSVKFCHNQRRLVAAGQQVHAGQHVADSGWSGRVIPPGPAGAHLHLELVAAGALRCPGPLLVALAAGRPAPPIASLPAGGCVE